MSTSTKPIPPLAVRELRSNAEIESAFALAQELRTHLKREQFLAQVRRQEAEGYVLIGGFAPELVALAGIRISSTLARGPHLFVDDLVTASSVRGKGYGQALLRWLAAYAEARGQTRIYLDSRDTALTFYKKVGFTCLTSVPCWIETDTLKQD